MMGVLSVFFFRERSGGDVCFLCVCVCVFVCVCVWCSGRVSVCSFVFSLVWARTSEHGEGGEGFGWRGGKHAHPRRKNSAPAPLIKKKTPPWPPAAPSRMSTHLVSEGTSTGVASPVSGAWVVGRGRAGAGRDERDERDEWGCAFLVQAWLGSRAWRGRTARPNACQV